MTELWTRSKLSQLSNQLAVLNRHVSDLLNETDKTLNSMRNFEPADDLASINSILEPQSVKEAERGAWIVERLAPYLDIIMWMHHTGVNDSWLMTRFAWRGQIFEMVHAECEIEGSAVPSVSPLKILKTQGFKILNALHLNFVNIDFDTPAFLLKPTPSDAFIVMSRTPATWLEEKITHIQKLINQSYTT